MKKVIAGGILRILEFDTKREAFIYIGKLRCSKTEFKFIWREELEGDRVRLAVITAYNGSPLTRDVDVAYHEEGKENYE